MNNIIVVNPGSTSTKLAIYSFVNNISDRSTIECNKIDMEEINNENPAADFLEDLRERHKKAINFMKKNSEKLGTVIAVAGRGGLLKPSKGGVYRVNDEMIDDLVSCRYGTHASNMGAPIAYEIAGLYNVDAFIACPVTLDEMDDIARYTGIPEIQRKSYFHALNQKSVAKKVSIELGMEYGHVNLIVAHLGGGITVGLHVRGKVVDVNNGLDGDGPFSVERSGSIPSGDLVKLCYSNRYSYKAMYKKIVGEGGIFAHLGTKDAFFIKKIMSDETVQYHIKTALTKDKVKRVIDACIYQVSKSICALACYTCGKIDGVVLTGGLARFEYFVQEIKRRVSFISKVFIIPGEEEMKALCESVVFALQGIEKIYEYRSEG